MVDRWITSGVVKADVYWLCMRLDVNVMRVIFESGERLRQYI